LGTFPVNWERSHEKKMPAYLFNRFCLAKFEISKKVDAPYCSAVALFIKQQLAVF
jgi:hypothetical protein